MNMIRSAIAGILALFAVASASAQQFNTIPYHTVIGRLGAAPGDTGPSQAIPFTTLSGQLLGNGFIQFTGPLSPVKTFTLPNASDTIAVLGQIQTWTGAQSFTDGKLILLGLTSGSSTLKAPATGGGTATLFPGTDTIVGRATTDTLTNKTLTFPFLTNPIVTGASPNTSGQLGYSIPNLNWYDGTTIRNVVGDTLTQTLTNKTLNCTNNTCTVRLGSDVTGTLLAAQEPAHTGDVTNSAGSLALAYANVVPVTKGGAGAVTGALRADGAGNVSQAQMSDISNYAQSTWTPTLIGQTSGSFTLTTAVGSYERIGRFIRASFTVISSANGAVGNVLLGGLPFASSATASDDGTCIISFQSGLTNTGGYTTFTGIILQSVSVAQLYENGSAVAAQQAATARFAAATTMIGTCFYHN